MEIRILENYSKIKVLKIGILKNYWEWNFFFLNLNLQIGMEIRLFEKLEFWKSFKRNLQKSNFDMWG